MADGDLFIHTQVELPAVVVAKPTGGTAAAKPTGGTAVQRPKGGTAT